MEAHQHTSSSEAARWEGMWSAGLKPGDAFDAARVEPALASAIALDDASKLDPPLGMSRASEMTALVPGCGRGYAVAALAKLDRFKHATGLEISSTAQKACEDYLKQEGVQSKASVVVADFFTHETQYNLVYDCTFLCAIPPSMRESWADQMSKIVAPGGELFQIVFPINESRDANVGPPFALSKSLVEGLLVPRGFTLVSYGASEQAARKAPGAEAVARWRRHE